MKEVKLSVNNKRFKCNFTLRDKVTVITGNSGTGKSVLAQKLYQHFEDVIISDDYSIVLMDTSMFNNWLKKANKFRNDRSLKDYWSNEENLPVVQSIIIVDDDDVIKSKDFELFFELSNDNYFLFLNRSKIGNIQYDVKDVYEMIQEQEYHKLLPVYKCECTNVSAKPDIFLVEDTGSGYVFFSTLLKDKIVVNSAYNLSTGIVSGKDNIINVLLALNNDYKGKSILLLVDYAAFGNNLKDVVLVSNTYNIQIYFYFRYQSFEYLLLKSNLIKDMDLCSYLNENILKFKTKENLYTKRLQELTAGKPYEYSKKAKSFPKCFYENCCYSIKHADCEYFRDASKQDKFQFLLADTEFEDLLEL